MDGPNNERDWDALIREHEEEIAALKEGHRRELDEARKPRVSGLVPGEGRDGLPEQDGFLTGLRG